MFPACSSHDLAMINRFSKNVSNNRFFGGRFTRCSSEHGALKSGFLAKIEIATIWRPARTPGARLTKKANKHKKLKPRQHRLHILHPLRRQTSDSVGNPPHTDEIWRLRTQTTSTVSIFSHIQICAHPIPRIHIFMNCQHPAPPPYRQEAK